MTLHYIYTRFEDMKNGLESLESDVRMYLDIADSAERGELKPAESSSRDESIYKAWFHPGEQETLLSYEIKLADVRLLKKSLFDEVEAKNYTEASIVCLRVADALCKKLGAVQRIAQIQKRAGDVDISKISIRKAEIMREIADIYRGRSKYFDNKKSKNGN